MTCVPLTFANIKKKTYSYFKDQMIYRTDESEEDIIINQSENWRDSIHDLSPDESNNSRKGGSSLIEIDFTHRIIVERFIYVFE